MRDINEVIREKEAELSRINDELAALKLTLRLLSEDSSEKPSASRDEAPRSVPTRIKSFP